MYIQVRYSTRNKFSKFINLEKPASFKEAREETVNVYDNFISGDCEDDKLICEDMYSRFNINPPSYVDSYNLKNVNVYHTSMTTGDIVIVNEKWYQCLPVGFSEIIR
jgi:hypothetical protein